MASSTVVIPAARGPPNARPCWLRAHPGGQLVIHHLLKALDLSAVRRVIVVAAGDHVRRWLNGDASALLDHLNHCGVVPPTTTVEVLPLEFETSSAAETVAYAIRQCGVEGSIFVKDQDGSFPHKVLPNANYVVGLRLTEHSEVEGIPSKSFLVCTGALLSSIVEKRIVSDVICVGGYAFQSARDFLETLERVKTLQAQVVSNLGAGAPTKFTTSSSATVPTPSHASVPPPTVGTRLFLSHLVQFQMLHEQKVFGVDFSSSFSDWKTEDSWRHFCRRYRNVEVALEGVLFVPRAPDDVVATLLDDNEQRVPVAANIAYLSKLRRDLTRITIRTCRPRSTAEATMRLLHAHHVPFDEVVYDALSATTVVLTAYGDQLPYPSGVAHSVREGLQNLFEVMH